MLVVGNGCGNATRASYPPANEEHSRSKKQRGRGKRKFAARVWGSGLDGGLRASFASGELAERLEGEGQIFGGLEAMVRAFLQAAADDALESRCDGRREIGNFWSVVLEDGGHGLRGSVAMKRTMPRNHFEQYGSEREHVIAGVD